MNVTVNGLPCYRCLGAVRHVPNCGNLRRIVAISDLHGILPDKLPESDILLIAGDLCPYWNHEIEFQRQWLIYGDFARWVCKVKTRGIIAVWGNHDLIGEQASEKTALVPVRILTDEVTEYLGLRIYGLPWQRRFCNWAFNLDTPDLDKKYEAIPDGVDIIVSHGPPHGYGDWVQGGELTGSEAFVKRIDEIKPQLVVYGHIHTSPGQWRRGDTTLANVTMLDDSYKPRYLPRSFLVHV